MHKQNQEKERENLRKGEKNLKNSPWENGGRIKGLWGSNLLPKKTEEPAPVAARLKRRKVCPGGCEVEEKKSVLKAKGGGN